MAWDRLLRWEASVTTNPVTWDPLNKSSNVILGGSDLICYAVLASDATVISTHGHSNLSGKWYAEFEIVGNSTESMFGLGPVDFDTSKFPGETVDSVGKYEIGIYVDGAQTVYGTAAVQTDIVGIALDFVNRKMFYSVNGVWDESSDPVAGTSPAWEAWASDADLYIICDPYTVSAAISINFGAKTFSHTVPAGYSAWDVIE